ncbi:MAG: hypothetical protein N4A71_05275 [Carboxylicivirga sp.]|jgi:hypothetical protein|nr:hypothetical protein [Carboxylicivirga sp.]
MKNGKYIVLIGMVVFVVIGGLFNWQINPKTDSSIQTSFSTSEIVFAVVLLVVVYGFYFVRRIRNIKTNAFKSKDEDYSEHRAPFRSAADYRDETQKTMNSFTKPEERSKEANNGEAVISGFASGPLYKWDGMYLSKVAGNKVLKFDGKYITDFSDNKVFTWESDCLSNFSGNKIYSASNGSISEFAGVKVYSYDNNSISEFAGAKLYTIKGDISVPEPLLIIIAVNLI